MIRCLLFSVSLLLTNWKAEVQACEFYYNDKGYFLCFQTEIQICDTECYFTHITVIDALIENLIIPDQCKVDLTYLDVSGNSLDCSSLASISELENLETLKLNRVFLYSVINELPISGLLNKLTWFEASVCGLLYLSAVFPNFVEVFPNLNHLNLHKTSFQAFRFDI